MRKKTTGSMVFDCVNYVICGFLGLITVLPFVYISVVSLIPPGDYRNYGLHFPRSFTLENYVMFFRAGSIIKDAYIVTIIVTAAGASIGLICTAMLGYALSKRKFPGRKALNYLVFIPLIFSGGLIPKYLVVHSLGLTNTLWSIIITSAIAPIFVFIMRTFFAKLPESLEESAFMDGANELIIMFRIIFPLSLPVFATIGMFYAIDRWNEWFEASIYISDPKLFPLQLALRNIINYNQSAVDPSAIDALNYQPPPGDIVKMSAIMISVLPILMLYPFAQRFFIKGVMLGSVKG